MAERRMKVRFYGKLADVFGSEREIAVDPPCTVAQLRELLAVEEPGAAQSLENKRVKACVGDTIVGDDEIIPQGEVLELLAPVSGG